MFVTLSWLFVLWLLESSAGNFQICTDGFNKGVGEDVTLCLPLAKRSEVFTKTTWEDDDDGDSEEARGFRRETRGRCDLTCSRIELDSSLAQMDMTHVHWPRWISQQSDPMAKCPTRLRILPRLDRVWPERLAEVECACEGSRCTVRGAHRCVTIYTLKTVYRVNGPSKELVAVDCICAIQSATLVRHLTPPIVS